MATEAKMDVQVGVDVSDVSRNLKKFRKETKDSFKEVEKNTKPLGRAFEALGGMVGKFALALGGILSARTLARLTAEATNFADAVGKSAQNLGVATEWLSKWRYAVGLSGVQANNFETAIQRMSRRLEQFRQTGGGEAAPALEMLGGGLKQMVKEGATVEELLPRIAEQLRKLSKPAQILASMKLFDTEGVRFGTVFLAQSAESIEKILQEADRYAPKITQEMADGAAALNDELSKLKANWAAFKQEAFTLSEEDGWWIRALNDIVLGMRQLRGLSIHDVGPSYNVQPPAYMYPGGKRPAPKTRVPKPGTAAPITKPGYTLEEIEGLEHAMGLAYNQVAEGPPAAAGLGGGGIFGVMGEGINKLTDSINTSGQQFSSWFEDLKTGAEAVGEKVKETTAAMNSEYVLFVESFKVTTETVLSATKGLIDQFAAGVGDSFALAIVYGEDLGEALLATLKDAAANLISTLIQLAIQQLVYLALSVSILSKRTASELASWSAIVYAAAFAASASLGIVGLLAAPGVAAKYTAKMLGGATLYGLIGKALGSAIPMAEGGIVTGPTLALLGEGGHSERVQPLDGSENQPMVVEVYLDSDPIARKMVERLPGVLRVDTRVGI